MVFILFEILKRHLWGSVVCWKCGCRPISSCKWICDYFLVRYLMAPFLTIRSVWQLAVWHENNDKKAVRANQKQVENIHYWLYVHFSAKKKKRAKHIYTLYILFRTGLASLMGSTCSWNLIFSTSKGSMIVLVITPDTAPAIRLWLKSVEAVIFWLLRQLALLGNGLHST